MISAKTNSHEPISLVHSHSYSGYQFYAHVSMKGNSADDCFKYIVLIILRWLDMRMGIKSNINPKHFKGLENGVIKTFSKDDELFQLNVTYSKETKEWAMELREPDTKIDISKCPVAGRSYVTHVGVRVFNKDCVEFGCKIDIKDPVNEPEINNAFRPLFIRHIFESDNRLNIEEGGIRLSKDCCEIAHSSDVQEILSIWNNSINQMPILIFVEKAQNKPSSANMCGKDFIMQNTMKERSSGLNMPKLHNFVTTKVDKTIESYFSSQKKEEEFETQFKKSSNDNTMQIKSDDVLFSECQKLAADKFASWGFGFCHTCFLPAKLIGKFSDESGITIDDNTIVILEPKVFSGHKQHSFKPPINKGWRRIQLLDEVRAYSKHKNYHYGNIRFASQLKMYLDEERVQQLIKQGYNGQRYDEMKTEFNSLIRRISDLSWQLEQSKCEKECEFQRAQEMYLDKARIAEEKQKLSEEKYSNIQEELMWIKDENETLKKRLQEKDDANTIKLIGVNPDKELFSFEQYDLIMCILNQARKTWYHGDSQMRAVELLDEIISNNELKWYGLKWIERIENVFKGCDEINAKHKSTLSQFGFEFDIGKNSRGHYRMSLKQSPGFYAELPSTPSDVRSMENNFHLVIEPQISIYKNFHIDQRQCVDNNKNEKQ